MLTQDDYKLWTGQSASSYTTAQWQKIWNAASARLARFLCLDSLPETLPDELAELAANFIAATINRQEGTGSVERKTVRNFTVEFRQPTAADAFAAIAGQFGDVIEAYTNCDLGINVEHSARHCCDGRL